MLLAISVFPVPGGPNKRTPLGGDRTPVNKSGRRSGIIMASRNVDLADSRPAISSHAERATYYVLGGFECMYEITHRRV